MATVDEQQQQQQQQLDAFFELRKLTNGANGEVLLGGHHAKDLLESTYLSLALVEFDEWLAG